MTFVKTIFLFLFGTAGIFSLVSAQTGVLTADELLLSIKTDSMQAPAGSTIKGDVNLFKAGDEHSPGKISIDKPLVFMKIRFEGAVNIGPQTHGKIRMSEYKNVVVFIDCEFTEPVTISNADFYEVVNFTGSKFRKGITIKNAHFSEEVSFNNASSMGSMSLQFSSFGRLASFESVSFADTVYIDNTDFNITPVFNGSKFYGPFHISNSRLRQDFLVSYTEYLNRFEAFNLIVEGDTYLSNSQLVFGAYFNNCFFQGRLIVDGTLLQDDLRFTHCYVLYSFPDKDSLILENEAEIIIRETE
jgi:hypothetical protein